MNDISILCGKKGNQRIKLKLTKIVNVRTTGYENN